MMDLNSIIRTISIDAVPVLLAITLHEAAHAWAAKRLGDATAFMLGRVSLNPMRHIDPLGTVVLPLFLILTTGFYMGWAKPVPVNVRGLRNPRRDMVLVSLAGPAANFLMAVAWGWIGVLAMQPWTGQFSYPLSAMSGFGVMFNVGLMVFNMLPIPPLDGSKILAGILPRDLAIQYSRLERYGMMILLILMYTRVLNQPLYFLYGLGDQLVSFFY